MEKKHDYDACSLNFANTSQHSIMDKVPENSTPAVTILYQRRKEPRDSNTVSAFQRYKMVYESNNSLSVICREAPSLATDKVKEIDTEATKNPVILPLKCRRGSVSSGCSLGEEEVDTDQVLKDLKYMEMLKLRLAAKKRKFNSSKNVDPKGPQENFPVTFLRVLSYFKIMLLFCDHTNKSFYWGRLQDMHRWKL